MLASTNWVKINKMFTLSPCTQRPHQGRMMEGQTPYNMFKKGLKLIPKEVRTKVA
ncbi:hypothetical protein J2Y64_004446 [Aeromonas salmonicida]|nr:hypothetical protein [Aeromonas salmonicida]